MDIKKVKDLVLNSFRNKKEVLVENEEVKFLAPSIIPLMNALGLTASYAELDFTNSAKFKQFRSQFRVVLLLKGEEVSSGKFEDESENPKEGIDKVRKVAKEGAQLRALTNLLSNEDLSFTSEEIKKILANK
jgi:hypothetical protein